MDWIGGEDRIVRNPYGELVKIPVEHEQPRFCLAPLLAEAINSSNICYCGNPWRLDDTECSVCQTKKETFDRWPLRLDQVLAPVRKLVITMRTDGRECYTDLRSGEWDDNLLNYDEMEKYKNDNTQVVRSLNKKVAGTASREFINIVRMYPSIL